MITLHMRQITTWREQSNARKKRVDRKLRRAMLHLTLTGAKFEHQSFDADAMEAFKRGWKAAI